MTFKTWYAWLRELPPLFRWFPVLVVLRPLVDNLYFLKEVSPLISPPYIVGVLTPILCIGAMIIYRFPRFSIVDKTFLWWSVLVLFNCLLLFFYDPLSLLTLEFLLKLALPVYLFFFLRLFIKTRRDLDGILTSFLYAAIFVAALLLFEILIQPISTQESRGLERIQGSFGDVVSYGMYIVFALIIATYFYFSRHHSVSLSKRLILISVVSIIGLAGLVNIHHTATYTVFSLVVLLFLFFNFRKGDPVAAFVLILFIGLAIDFAGSEVIEEKITPLVQTDMRVYAGEVETDRLLHGRVGRWRMMLEKFSSEPVTVQFFGYPLKFEYAYQFIGIGSHNDFIRMLFAAGIAGLILYLIFLGVVFREARRLGIAQRYLFFAVFLALFFYSISVTPTIYAPFMYFALPVFAFVSLPENQRMQWDGRE